MNILSDSTGIINTTHKKNKKHQEYVINIYVEIKNSVVLHQILDEARQEFYSLKQINMKMYIASKNRSSQISLQHS